MNHSDHLRTVVECVGKDIPVPFCLECIEIVESFTVAGPPIKIAGFDDEEV